MPCLLLQIVLLQHRISLEDDIRALGYPLGDDDMFRLCRLQFVRMGSLAVVPDLPGTSRRLASLSIYPALMTEVPLHHPTAQNSHLLIPMMTSMSLQTSRGPSLPKHLGSRYPPFHQAHLQSLPNHSPHNEVRGLVPLASSHLGTHRTSLVSVDLTLLPIFLQNPEETITSGGPTGQAGSVQMGRALTCINAALPICERAIVGGLQLKVTIRLDQ
jgi:hypothetical protein